MGPRIVLVSPKDSANVGAAARGMMNFGLDDLVLVAPRCRIDHRAFALASHASEVLERARVVDELGSALADRVVVLGTTARERASEGFQVASPREALPNLPAHGSAVVFGREDFGLTNAELDLCQTVVRIPTAAYASLNLGQAGNIIAYEWFVGRQGADLGEPVVAELPAELRPAAREQMEGMISQLMELLHHIGYTDAHRARGVEHIFRRLFDRAGPNAREVAALRGLWSQARWAAEQPPDSLPGRRG